MIDIFEIYDYNSLYELKKSIAQNFKIFGNLNETLNSFKRISIKNNKFNFGIAYYNNGIDPQIVSLSKDQSLLIGFEESIIYVDFSNEISFNEIKISSIFYEFILIESLKKVIIICELDIYVLNYEGKIIWNIGFREIVENYELLDYDFITISTVDGDTTCFSVFDGSVKIELFNE